MKLLFIINPISGGKEKTDWETQIREYFKESPHAMDFYLLTGNSDSASIEHHINSVNPDRVVAVGGDGTVKMLAGFLKEKNTSLGIIPAGSANGMAKELGIPQDVNIALDVAVNGEEKAIDLIKINNDHFCIHLSDIGLNAMLVKYFEQSKKRGMWNYTKGFVKTLIVKQKMYVTIKTDTEVYKRKAYMVALANATKYGTGATINPTGDIADGLFEVVVVRKVNLLEVFKGVVTHKEFHPNRIEVFQTKTLELNTLEKTYFQVDGEYLGKIKKLTAEIIPNCLKIIFPSNSED
ncbi:MAG: diacylglycerol kinase family protein [Chitinophagaceae bacterium]